MPQKALAKKFEIYYNLRYKKATAHKGLTSENSSNATLHSPKYKGGFCYVWLLTKRKHECKQCQKEYAKCQQLHKRSIAIAFSLFHKHHPHSL